MASKKEHGPGSGREMSASEEREFALEHLAGEYREANRRIRAAIDLNATGEEEATDTDGAQLRRDLRLAMERVGVSTEDRARWLVNFATQDLAKLSAGDLWNLQWDVLAFAAAPGSTCIAFEFFAENGRVAVDIAAIHGWLSGLNGLTGQVRIVKVHPEGREEEQPPVWNIEANVVHTIGLVNGRLVDLSSANALSTIARFKNQVYNVVSTQAARFRFCQNCGKLFVARKRQAYCTSKCSQALRTRKYRTRDPEKFRRLRRIRGKHRNAKVTRRNVRPRRHGAEPSREEP